MTNSCYSSILFSLYVLGTKCEKERMEALQLIEDDFQDVCVPECDKNGYYVRRCTACNWYTCYR